MRAYAAFLVAILAASAVPVGAAEESSRSEVSYEIAIPAGSLVSAIDRLRAQSGISILYKTSMAAGIHVPALNGTFTVKAALAQLLVDTDIRVESANAKTIVLKKETAGSVVSPADQMRVAEAAKVKVASAAKGTDGDKNQVTVEGQRDRPPPFSTGNLDLTRTEDDVLPFQVFTAREIELSGVSSLQEFLRERLPQNFSLEIPEEMDGGAIDTTGRVNLVDMRGWGAGETVFLLNGRRMANEYQAVMTDGPNATPNLRAIPLASIERIEILSSAGSAIYGANATGGVINIITRQDFTGGLLSMSYATPSDVNAPKRDVQFSYGFALHPRMRLNLNAGYSDSQPLRAGDRSGVTTERWRERAGYNETNFGISGVSRYGARPNLSAVSVSSGDLFPDIAGQQAYAHPAAGYAGGGGRANFEPGVYLKLSEGTAGSSRYGKGSYLGPETSSLTFNLGTQISFSERWGWSIDARYARSDSEGASNATLLFNEVSDPTRRQSRVPAAAEINPFGQDVVVYLVDSLLDRPELRNKPNTTTWALSTTLNGEIGEWRGFLDLSYSHNRNRLRQNEFWEPDGGWYSAFMTGQYNPFVDVSQVAPAVPEFYEHYTVRGVHYDSATRNYTVGIKASGPLFTLPANQVRLTVGLDGSRGDRYQSSQEEQFLDAATGALRIPVDVGTRRARGTFLRDPNRRFVFDSYAGYAETTVPLISAAQKIPLVKELEIFASGRLDYTVRDGFRSQSTTDTQNGVPPQPVKYTQSTHLYASGFKYQVVEGVTFRASRSVGFRPPNLGQVTPANPPTENCCSGAAPMDPVRDEPLPILTPDMYITGGNPDLKAESTVSTNLGLILTPAWLRDLRVSVDYIENIRNDAIFSFSADSTSVEDALGLEDDFPGLISRNAPDGHPSGVGQVRFVDLRYTNLRRISSKSIDFNIAQQVRDVFGGTVSLSVNASRNLSFKVQKTNTGPEEEQIRRRVGSSLSSSRQIEWNANGQVRWDGQHWGFGWNTRYFDYLLVTGSSVSSLATAINNQGSDRVPWKLNHDINVSYRAPVEQNPTGLRWFLSGTSITFTVQNLFDRKPRFWYASKDYGVAPGDSIAGRTLTLGFRKDL